MPFRSFLPSSCTASLRAAAGASTFIAAMAVGSLSFSAVAAGASLPTKQEIVIGTTVGDFADMVTDSIKPQLEAKGYKVKLVEFTDYVTPNIALADGSLDVNCFQHKPYLESFAKDRGLSLAPITQVPTGPMGSTPASWRHSTRCKRGARWLFPTIPPIRRGRC